MQSARLRIRLGYLAGTALALILTATSAISAAPQNTNAFVAPQPARDYSTPGSMPKPSSSADDTIRFRGTLPANDVPPPRQETSTLPAPATSEASRFDQPSKPVRPAPNARPVSAPDTARAQAEPEPIAAAPVPVAEPVARIAPAPEAPPRPVAAPVRLQAPAAETIARVAPPAEPVARVAPAPEAPPRPVAAPVRAPAPVAAPVAAPAPVAPAAERVARPARPVAAEAPTTPAPNAASEADVGNKIREIVTGKQFDRIVIRKPDRDAIVALYSKARSFQPLWVAQGAPSARARDVLDYLNRDSPDDSRTGVSIGVLRPCHKTDADRREVPTHYRLFGQPERWSRG